MATRIPSALNWLLEKRARLLGNIKRNETALQERDRELDVIRDDFRARE